MKALQLIHSKAPLTLVEIPEPVAKKDEAIVSLLASHIPSFSSRVFDGSLGYMFPARDRFIPGTSAVGRVEQCDDSNGVVRKGDIVFFDNFLYARNSSDRSEAVLMGWTGLGERSSLTQQRWADGVWSEKFICPVGQLHVIPAGSPYSPLQWAALNYLNISYGALLKAGFEPGMSLVVNGATGGLGSGVVLIAEALGAAKVTAVGRDEAGLAALKNLSPERIVPVRMDGSYEEYSTAIRKAAGGADIVIDALGGAKSGEPTLACIRSLKKGGTAVFLGSVLADIPLSYMEIMLGEIQIRGCFMYPADAPPRLIHLIHSGLVRLDSIATPSYPFESMDEAVASAEEGGPLRFVMLEPHH